MDAMRLLTTPQAVAPRNRFPPLLLGLLAYGRLLYFELFLVRRDFKGLHEKVRRCPTHSDPPAPGTIERICEAVDFAAMCYWKQVLCLQRSAVTACLLKRFGVPAQMVIGVQQLPFKAHAWVEVAGRVVNDKPYVPELFAVLDRC
jgi:hypothetical protein